jgi:hypothetical protein
MDDSGDEVSEGDDENNFDGGYKYRDEELHGRALVYVCRLLPKNIRNPRSP